MLVAALNDQRIEARTAEKGHGYHCPQCRGEVILKKGRKVTAHFAHKPPTDCAWATGETRAHLDAKLAIANALSARGLRTEVEHFVPSMHGDRRADVMVWSPAGRMVAIELQHTAISIDEIERRAFCYARSGIAQIWIPFIKGDFLEDVQGDCLLFKYSPRPFERWVHGMNEKRGMWIYDQSSKKLYLGSLSGHRIWVEESSWWEGEGWDAEEVSVGGYYRWSKRWKDLTINGPYDADTLLIKLFKRESFSAKGYKWPAGLVAHLTPASGL